MSKPSLYFTLLFFSFFANAQKVTITFDYSMLEELIHLYDQKNYSDAEFNSLIGKKGTRGLIKKMQSYFPEADEHSYEQSIKSLLGLDAEGDVFMYQRIKPKIEDISQLLLKVKKEKQTIIQGIENALKEHVADTETIKVRVFLVLGAVGGGWTFSDEKNTFYIDASMLQSNDLVGLEYLCVHEILHLIQDATRPKIEQNDAVNYFLEQAFREGTATYLADFSDIKNAVGYSKFNQNIYKKNQRRKEANYALFELILHGLQKSPSFSYSSADHIGLSGMYESPAYFVIYDMIKTIETVKGKKQAIESFQLSAPDFIRYYNSIVNEESSPATYYKFSSEILQMLEK